MLRQQKESLTSFRNDYKIVLDNPKLKINEQDACFLAVASACDAFEPNASNARADNENLRQLKKNLEEEAVSASQNMEARGLKDFVHSYLPTCSVLPSKSINVSFHGCKKSSASFTLGEILWLRTGTAGQRNSGSMLKSSSLHITDASLIFLLRLSLLVTSTTFLLYYFTLPYSPQPSPKNISVSTGLRPFLPSSPSLM